MGEEIIFLLQQRLWTSLESSLGHKFEPLILSASLFCKLKWQLVKYDSFSCQISWFSTGFINATASDWMKNLKCAPVYESGDRENCNSKTQLAWQSPRLEIVSPARAAADSHRLAAHWKSRANVNDSIIMRINATRGFIWLGVEMRALKAQNHREISSSFDVMKPFRERMNNASQPGEQTTASSQ